MTLKLPRLQRNIPTVDQRGMPTREFHTWWDRVMKAIEDLRELVGYTSGGGTVTQLTSKVTDVTINKPCGQIVTHNQSLTSGASAAFFLLNSYIDANDIVLVQFQEAAGGVHGILDYTIRAGQVVDGGCAIVITNNSASTLGEAITLNFAVIKSVVS